MESDYDNYLENFREYCEKDLQDEGHVEFDYVDGD